jgi:transcriptional regulator with XRE-family HTH domain
MPNTTYGTVLKRMRERKGLTIREVAMAADIDPSLLSRLETGSVTDISLTRAASLCGVLGLSLDDLAGVKAIRRPTPNPRAKTVRDLLKAALDELGRLEKGNS